MKDKHDKITMEMDLEENIMTTAKYQASYLQWAGGKGKVLPHLLPILDKYRQPHFCEPFVGAGNVALNVECSKYTLVDINKDLIDSHKFVSTNYQEYIDHTQEYFNMGFDPYYELRDTFNALPSGDEGRVALFQYLNKHGFNGLCRYNKSGKFNTPKGTVKKNKVKLPLQQIQAFSDKFKSDDFVCGSFENYFDFDEDTLIYCDPPYVPMTASDFKYDAKGFTPDDQIKLRDLARDSRHTVVISNHWNEVAQELYKDADEVHVIDVQRTISCKGSERIKVKECIVVYF